MMIKRDAMQSYSFDYPDLLLVKPLSSWSGYCGSSWVEVCYTHTQILQLVAYNVMWAMHSNSRFFSPCEGRLNPNELLCIYSLSQGRVLIEFQTSEMDVAPRGWFLSLRACLGLRCGIATAASSPWHRKRERQFILTVSVSCAVKRIIDTVTRLEAEC